MFAKNFFAPSHFAPRFFAPGVTEQPFVRLRYSRFPAFGGGSHAHRISEPNELPVGKKHEERLSRNEARRIIALMLLMGDL